MHGPRGPRPLRALSELAWAGSWAISSKGARDEDARLSPVAFASDAGWFESNRIVSARAAGITDPYAGHDEWW